MKKRFEVRISVICYYAGSERVCNGKEPKMPAFLDGAGFNMLYFLDSCGNLRFYFWERDDRERSASWNRIKIHLN